MRKKSFWLRYRKAKTFPKPGHESSLRCWCLVLSTEMFSLFLLYQWTNGVPLRAVVKDLSLKYIARFANPSCGQTSAFDSVLKGIQMCRTTLHVNFRPKFTSGLMAEIFSRISYTACLAQPVRTLGQIIPSIKAKKRLNHHSWLELLYLKCVGH